MHNAPPHLHALGDWRAELRLSGDDAASFLQGQLTADIQGLDAEHWRYAAYNSAKGRMLGFGLIRRENSALVWEVERDQAANLCKRLAMFVLRAKVVIETSRDPSLGLRGPRAAEALAACGLPPPAGDHSLSRNRDICVLRRGCSDAFSLHGNASALTALRSELQAFGVIDGDEDSWRAAEITAGIPAVHPATQDHFVPQMANVDWLGGISFTKGCYTGQEIVARLHYLGQVKRRLFACDAEGPRPQPGEDIVGLSDGGELTVGEVCDVAAIGEDRFVLSAVLQLAQADTHVLRTAGGARLTIRQRFAPPPDRALAARGPT